MAFGIAGSSNVNWSPALPRVRAGVAPRDPFAQQTPQQIAQVIGQALARLPAALSPAQIRAQVAGYGATLPKPSSAGQIQTQAQGMLDPVIQRITAAISQRAAGQANAVGGYTNQLAHNLAGLNLGAPYQ